MQWPELVAQLSYYTQQEQPDPSFTAATCRFVSNAELRIYRELNFSASSGQNFSLSTTPFQRAVDLTRMTGQTVAGGTAVFQQYPVVVESLAVQVNNRWISCQLVSQDFLDLIWPDQTLSQAPGVGLAYYTLLDNETALIAPVPDNAYPIRISGQWRPAPMSASNPKTWLGENVPDLLFCGVMVEAMAYQRDFGAQSDDPRAAMSWEQRFQDAKKSALREENLRQGLGVGFSPYPPAPMAHAQ